MERLDRSGTPQIMHGPEPPDVGQLRRAILAWGKAAPGDQTMNGQFLSTFAVYLVKHFREEEARLAHGPSQDAARRRMEHRRLVERLGHLMGDLARGLDVDSGIKGFIRVWQAHQEAVALRKVRGSAGH